MKTIRFEMYTTETHTSVMFKLNVTRTSTYQSLLCFQIYLQSLSSYINIHYVKKCKRKYNTYVKIPNTRFIFILFFCLYYEAFAASGLLCT